MFQFLFPRGQPATFLLAAIGQLLKGFGITWEIICVIAKFGNPFANGIGVRFLGVIVDVDDVRCEVQCYGLHTFLVDHLCFDRLLAHIAYTGRMDLQFLDLLVLREHYRS